MAELQIRSFNEKDIDNLLELYEEQFTETFGYIPKTTELWKYFVLNKPGILKESIFVAQQNGEIIGYIVLGFKRMGPATVVTIYEFCAKNERIATALLEKASEYAENKNVDYVLIQIAPSVQLIHEAIRKFGFVKMTRPQMKIMVTLIDPAKIIVKLARIFNEQQKTGKIRKFLGKNKKIRIKIDDFEVGLSLHDGKLDAIDENKDEADAELEMKAHDFLRIFFGQASIFWEFLTGRVKIRGLVSNMYIFSLVNALRIKKPFFFPLTDHF